jgi:IS30 family transposase
VKIVIAERIGKDQTTVSKEVKKHMEVTLSSVKCLNPDGTEKEPRPCPSLLKAPFVCNACQKRHSRCTFQKQLYRAKRAQTDYKTLLSESREGIPLNGIKQGQHLYHITQTNDLGVSKSTVYRHLHRGYLSVGKLDFPRIVKFKQRSKRPQEHIPKGVKIGRTHEDFLAYTKENGITSWIEMDTVIGRIGGKVIMTLDFTFCNFMVGVLLANKSSYEVAAKVRRLKAELSSGGVSLGDVFPLILTDNGGEFADVCAIENRADALKETMLFFCDPMQSCQKAKVEKNHTLFRDIVPKGESFDQFTQDTVNLIFSHVNGVKRKSLNGKSPYDVFAFTYGEELTAILGIIAIPADKVTQSPRLLRG